ncbi:hybrid sensor histidine kinase/response regulator transcription factor [Sphingobacterium multivorum]|uniref:hybrid sensor histidine kinase/response regulator transcription factor n=1 Tax=Sphingobacterium multivorum TaxID=28454 RepID=UPI0028A93040|nr:two-component regulator propeller domain-containing protein [Sphingobacterium multivorum]
MKRFILLILLFAAVASFGQQYKFAQLNTRNGIVGNEVVAIHKDGRGFLWFTTNTGLNRFDGERIKIFNRSSDAPADSHYDAMKRIVEDEKGNLWMMGNKYVMFDWRKEVFVSNTDSLLEQMSLPPNPVSIQIDQFKNFIVAYAHKGIYKFEPKTKKLSVYKPLNDITTIASTEIVEIALKGPFVWILHKDGLLERLNSSTGKVDLRKNQLKGTPINTLIPKRIFIDPDDMVWIYPGLNNKGAVCYNETNDQWKQLDIDSKPALSNSFVRGMIADHQGLIWIATDHGGINLFDKKSNTVRVIQHEEYNNNSLGQNSIVSLYCDPQGIVWAGTYKNGVSYYHPDMFRFPGTGIARESDRRNIIFDCSSILKDKDNNLWLGTNGKGLIKLNEHSGKSQFFRNKREDNNSLSSDIVTTLFEDHSKKIWAGTFMGGLNSYDGQRFKRYKVEEKNKNSLSNLSVYGLTEDSNHNLWIATLGGGIDRLDPSRSIFSNFNRENSKLRSDFMLSAIHAADGTISFSSDIGVYKIGPDQTIQPYFPNADFQDKASAVPVYQLMKDSGGRIWLATKRGIKIFDPAKGSFTKLTLTDGLSSDDVRSLAEDREGYIWAGTSYGLNRIQYIPGEGNEYKCIVSAFDLSDGLSGMVFNPNAVYVDKTGKIYMGTTEGYVGFHPKSIPVNTSVPRARFTELLLSNELLNPGDKRNGHVVLPRSIVDLDHITLKYNETNFTIRFSAFNFMHPEKNKYRYKLEGVDKEWIETSRSTGFATYSNLNPGTYVLQVYAGNEDNVWSSKPIEMRIIVTPPFWWSWWAIALYVVIFILLVRWFIKYRLKRKRSQLDQKARMLEADKLHEIDQLKLKFFTNISHEFKTPLSLIISPLEMLIKNDHPHEQNAVLGVMYKNAQKLLTMVNDILDFRKLDQDKTKLNISSGNMIEFVKEISTSFLSIAAEKSIKLTYTTKHQYIDLQFDKDKMYMAISNLISNAFKYTRNNGHVDVSVDINETIRDHEIYKSLCIKVMDTGIGIERSHLEHIFDRFYRIESNETHGIAGTGVGLHIVNEFVRLHGGTVDVDSELGKGTVFTVLIPMLKEGYGINRQDVIYSGTAIEIDTKESADSENDALLEGEHSVYTLLIIDDNEDFRLFLKDLFGAEYRVLSAKDGQQGYDLAVEYIPDVVLCDVMMPNVDGYEFCRKVKQDIRISHIPVVLLTAKCSDENQFQGMEAGADAYISKPFNIDILRVTLANIAKRQKQLQEKFKSRIAISTTKPEIVSMDQKFMQKAISIVEINIGKADFLVEDLCREMAMSRVNFYKKILALTDKTPSEFIRFIRLKRAAELLDKSQLYVAEVAFLVGFNEPKYFRKYFKEEFGVTPNEYKKNTINNL